MSMAIALEDLALGEVTLKEGAATVNLALRNLDEAGACDLYEALRAWIWKALEARRRDDELSGWMDLFSRASSRIEVHSRDLATKLEGFMELLQASIMTASAGTGRDALQRKHAKDVLRKIYRSGGRMRKASIMQSLTMKGPNLSRVMAPLQDDGFVVREIEGRDAFYRLTMKGNEAVLPHMAHDDLSVRRDELPLISVHYKNNVARGMLVTAWNTKQTKYCTADIFSDGGGYRFDPHPAEEGEMIGLPPYALSLSDDRSSHQPLVSA